MKSFGWMVMSSLTIFLVATSTSWAQEAADPPLDCENDRSVGACMGELLDEEFKMIEGLEGMMRDMQAMGLFSLAQERLGMAAAVPAMQELFDTIGALKRQHGRAVEVAGVTTDEQFNELFEQGDTEKGKNCKFSDKPFVDSIRDENTGALDLESIGLQSVGPFFDNDKCDIFDAVDLAGDPVRVHEKKENMCERVCKEKRNNQGQGQMGKTKDRFVLDLVDGIAAARSANQTISIQRARMSELGLLLAELRLSEGGLQVATATAGPSDPCAVSPPGAPVDLILAAFLESGITILNVVIIAEDVVIAILGATKDVSKQVCWQTAFGFNGSTGCIPVVVAFAIVKAIKGVTAGAKSLLGNTKNFILMGFKIANKFKTDKLKLCAQIIRDDTVKVKEEFLGFQCVNALCNGGPNDNNACVNDSDCSGAIVKLQVAAGETSAALAEIKAEVALMKSLVEETRDLLLTPPGRRKGFQARP